MARHKWNRIGHALDHRWECVKCGCIKDCNAMLNTYYYLDGEKFETAGECKGVKISSNPVVIGSCFCGEQGVIIAFGETFCQKHNDELARSFEARMCDWEKNNLL